MAPALLETNVLVHAADRRFPLRTAPAVTESIAGRRCDLFAPEACHFRLQHFREAVRYVRRNVG